MKKLKTISLSLILISALFTGCGSNKNNSQYPMQSTNNPITTTTENTFETNAPKILDSNSIDDTVADTPTLNFPVSTIGYCNQGAETSDEIIETLLKAVHTNDVELLYSLFNIDELNELSVPLGNSEFNKYYTNTINNGGNEFNLEKLNQSEELIRSENKDTLTSLLRANLTYLSQKRVEDLQNNDTEDIPSFTWHQTFEPEEPIYPSDKFAYYEIDVPDLNISKELFYTSVYITYNTPSGEELTYSAIPDEDDILVYCSDGHWYLSYYYFHAMSTRGYITSLY